MKNLYCILFFLYILKGFSQITMEFELSLFPDTKQYDGTITICNNSGKQLPGGYTFEVVWPALKTMTYGLSIEKSGVNSCDTQLLSTATWDIISNGSCKTIEIGGVYEAPMFLPPRGISSLGDTITLIHSNKSYIPGAENAGSPNSTFYFKKECFISSPKEIQLGEATLLEWGVPTDMFFPDNKKSWAIANAHAHTLFNNLVGKEIITPNHFNATTLNESHCGCEDGLINDPNALNPLSYQAHTVSDGCFQMTPTGWLQIEQFFPEFLNGLSHSNIVTGDYVRSCLLRTYYDMTSLLYWEKVKCYNPIEMITKSKDPYLAEELFGMAFYRGFDFNGIDKIFKTEREKYLLSENIVEELYTTKDVDNGTVIYGMRQRNNAKQLDNNTNVSWAKNSMYYNPNLFKWKGWYNDAIYWTNIEDYLEEIAPLFPNVNLTILKTKLQPVFNENSVNNTIPFSKLGPVIDEIVLNLPAYDGNKGMSVIYNSDMITCNSSAISITSCKELCPGEKGEITINLMGTPPFNYTIIGSNNEEYTGTNILGSPVILEVNDPGKYTVQSFSDAFYSPFINCHFASTIVKNAGTDDVFWNESKMNDHSNCVKDELTLIGTGFGPWTIDYTLNDQVQKQIQFSISPYKLSNSPVSGVYKITQMQAGGCTSPNNSEITVCLPVNVKENRKQSSKIFPNPLQKGDMLRILNSQHITQIKIWNNKRQLVIENSPVKQEEINISTSNLFEGIYFIEIWENDIMQDVQKIIIQN